MSTSIFLSIDVDIRSAVWQGVRVIVFSGTSVKESKYMRRYRSSLESIILYAQRELNALERKGYGPATSTIRAACNGLVFDATQLEASIEIEDDCDV